MLNSISWFLTYNILAFVLHTCTLFDDTLFLVFVPIPLIASFLSLMFGMLCNR